MSITFCNVSQSPCKLVKSKLVIVDCQFHFTLFSFQHNGWKWGCGKKPSCNVFSPNRKFSDLGMSCVFPVEKEFTCCVTWRTLSRSGAKIVSTFSNRKTHKTLLQSCLQKISSYVALPVLAQLGLVVQKNTLCLEKSLLWIFKSRTNTNCHFPSQR